MYTFPSANGQQPRDIVNVLFPFSSSFINTPLLINLEPVYSYWSWSREPNVAMAVDANGRTQTVSGGGRAIESEQNGQMIATNSP